MKTKTKRATKVAIPLLPDVTETEEASVKGGKRGFYSKAEIATLKGYIKDKLTIDQIAMRMNRRVDSVQKEIDKIHGVAEAPSKIGLAKQLELRPEWKKWQAQFTKPELEQFKNQYVQLMAAFDNNVRATEELQIFQVITLIILIDRTLVEQKVAVDAMERLQPRIDTLRAKGKEDEAELLDSQYEMKRAVSKTCADKYKTYSDKQNQLLQQLKGTRDQRIKNFESSDKSFVGLLRFLSEEDNRVKAGREMEMVRLASQKEKVRMSQPHRYIDGTVDRPLLSAESVMMEDEYVEEIKSEVDVSGDPAQDDAFHAEESDAVQLP